MPKITDLTSASVVDGTVILPIIKNETGTLTSEQTTLAIIKNFILAGNAATSTKFATPVTINGVSFDGSASITVTVPLSAATTSTLGGVIVPVVGTSGITNSSGTIGLATASNTQLGGVKVDSSTITINGSGVISVTASSSTQLGAVIVPTTSALKVDGSGNISENIVVHAFSFDANYNLIYSKITDTNITMTTDGVNSSYVTYDVGNSQYAYSLDSNGNLIATYSS